MDRARSYLRALLLLRRARARPGTYRHGFGTILAFLQGVLLIRVLANLGILLELSKRVGPLRTEAFLAASLGILGAYGVTVLPLSSYRFLHDLLHHERLEEAPHGGATRLAALAGSVFLRPTSVAVVATGVVTALVSGLLDDFASAAAMLPILLIAIGSGTFLLLAVTSVLRLGEEDCEYFELAAIATIVLANPDMRLDGRDAYLELFLSRVPELPELLIVIALPGVALLVTVMAILIVRGIEAGLRRLLSAGEGSGRDGGVTVRYALGGRLFRRRSRVALWIAAYAASLPALVSSETRSSIARAICAAILAFGAVEFLRFAARIEREIEERLLVTLRRADRVALLARPLGATLLFALLPVALRATYVIVSGAG